MDESYYTARLVITEGYEDRLDMTITCKNAQQLLRAKDTIADQMNTYIAEFAVQSSLTGTPSNAEQNAAALQAVIREQTERAKQQEPEEPAEPEPPEATPDEPEKSPPPSHDDALDAVRYRPDLASIKLAPTETPKKAAAPSGAKGLLKLKCPKCGDEFVAFTKDYRTEWTCKECGSKIPLTSTVPFEYDCKCERHLFGRTNIEDSTITITCGSCGCFTDLRWNPKTKKYME